MERLCATAGNFIHQVKPTEGRKPSASYTCKDCKEYNAISLSEQSVHLIKILYENNDLKNLPENVQFKDEDVISIIRCFFEVIGKNLAKKFKTFEEYNLFYNKNIIYNKIT